MAIDDKVQAFLEMVLVHPSSKSVRESGLLVVADEKDRIREGVVIDVGTDVPILREGDTIFYCSHFDLEECVAVHFSDVIAFKRLYSE